MSTSSIKTHRQAWDDRHGSHSVGCGTLFDHVTLAAGNHRLSPLLVPTWYHEPNFPAEACAIICGVDGCKSLPPPRPVSRG